MYGAGRLTLPIRNLHVVQSEIGEEDQCGGTGKAGHPVKPGWGLFDLPQMVQVRGGCTRSLKGTDISQGGYPGQGGPGRRGGSILGNKAMHFQDIPWLIWP